MSETRLVIDEEGKAGGYFPQEFFVDFLRFLRQNDDVIQVITYDDLPWEEDYDYEKSYIDEYKRWKKQADPEKIYVLLQHDVDSSPYRSMAILKEEEKLGIPSNSMIFNKRINRRHLKKTGELLYTEYDLDFELMKRLQDEHGFVFGYHNNAFEQSLYDDQLAEEIFIKDVEELRKKLQIKYFSPHGGAASPDGKNNKDMDLPEKLKNEIRWVANRFTVRFDGVYSDGGINSANRDPKKRDLRDFVRTWKRGKRYRVLTHPQYYHTPCEPSPRMKGTEWYDDLLLHYENSDVSVWDDVTIK